MSNANININLQQSNNYMVILKGDEQFNSKDVTFYIQNFEMPDMSIDVVNVGQLQNTIPYPSQGIMNYDPLTLEVLVDDNLNSYLELLGWLHRLKDPEKLLKSHLNGFDPMAPNYSVQSRKAVYEASNQYPIEYRDLDVKITDTNHNHILTFNFMDAFISGISGLSLNTQNADYLTINATFYYTLARVFDPHGTQLIPQSDDNLRTY